MEVMVAMKSDAQTQSSDEWSMQLHISDARLQPPLLHLLCWWCDPDAVRHSQISAFCFYTFLLLCFYGEAERVRPVEYVLQRSELCLNGQHAGWSVETLMVLC
jgi:hypothetical protein